MNYPYPNQLQPIFLPQYFYNLNITQYSVQGRQSGQSSKRLLSPTTKLILKTNDINSHNQFFITATLFGYYDDFLYSNQDNLIGSKILFGVKENSLLNNLNKVDSYCFEFKDLAIRKIGNYKIKYDLYKYNIGIGSTFIKSLFSSKITIYSTRSFYSNSKKKRVNNDNDNVNVNVNDNDNVNLNLNVNVNIGKMNNDNNNENQNNEKNSNIDKKKKKKYNSNNDIYGTGINNDNHSKDINSDNYSTDTNDENYSIGKNNVLINFPSFCNYHLDIKVKPKSFNINPRLLNLDSADITPDLKTFSFSGDFELDVIPKFSNH
ncbi:uncharacterized protein ASCRUDRAFT_97889 [Ascoidea rubescens DSM 1968]|uniref:Velvet domain-containing protein n=1 Tax=Ascoidea rubescens DSM 1968 TaxID=1344418 RepID=A0A1D2VQ22_9ASCO|nr:hypothetical protein ASCRUDRAFT_97889 [Ascoidea rubescens DSM 1968]ODV63655.1 hypothetical protein ASCRUDRAFT_97889 [Ascoidea rubescens DSM 1968]